MNRFLNRVLVGKDITQARRRIRWAWIAGFAFASVGLLNALLLFSGFDSEVENLWSGGQFSWVVFESGLMAVLSYGVFKRARLAAVSLFFYFWISQRAVAKEQALSDSPDSITWGTIPLKD